jgi:hypothetical protein
MSNDLGESIDNIFSAAPSINTSPSSAVISPHPANPSKYNNFVEMSR